MSNNSTANTIISMNPTGTYNQKSNGIKVMNGNNNIVMNSQNASKTNLDKVQNNEVVCSNIENFGNFCNNKIYFDLFILLILFIFLFFLVFKKNLYI